MQTDWVQILAIVFGSGGVITGVASLMKTKADNDRIDSTTFKTFFDESQERYENELQRMKESSEEYRKTTDDEILQLKEDIKKMNRNQNISIRAINSAYRCGYPPKLNECPVLKTLDIESSKSNKKCNELKNKGYDAK